MWVDVCFSFNFGANTAKRKKERKNIQKATPKARFAV